MMKIKNMLCLLLAVAMLFALCACGSDEKVSGDVDKSDVAEPSGSVNAETDSEFDIGHVNGGKYENSFFAFGCEVDSGWTYATEDELLSVHDDIMGEFSDEEIKEQLMNADMFYDMMVSSNDGYANINVVIQNIGIMYGTIYSEDKIVEMNIDQLPDTLASAGMEVQSIEPTTIELAGAERSAIKMHNVYQGVDVYQTAVLIKNGSYLANITISSYMNDITSDLAALFYAL